MDAKLIEKLRRKQSLPKLPDGQEGVTVTLQYPGKVPAATRGERKQWLEKHFQGLGEELGSIGVEVKPEGISTSAQTLRLVVPVAQLDKLDDKATSAGHHLEIVVDEQVL
jgi:hypothetical protein